MLDTQMRGQAYISLSQLLLRPDKELLELLSSLEFRKLWLEVEASYGVQFPKSWELSALPEFTSWDQMWALTMGPIKPLAEPIESLYKVWTRDPSCELLIANQKGYLKGDWACHMEELLTHVGFEIPPQFVHCPDHLVLELEFANILVEETPIEAQIKFAEHHFDWLKDLYETAMEKDVPQMYQDLYKLCAQFVKADIGSLV